MMYLGVLNNEPKDAVNWFSQTQSSTNLLVYKREYMYDALLYINVDF